MRAKFVDKRIFSIAAVMISVIFLGSCGGTNQRQPEQQTSKQDKYETGISLSDDLMDFTVQINDIVYRLPMKKEFFEKNGWSLPDYFDGSEQILSEHYDSSVFTKGDCKLDVDFINMTLDAQKLSDCPIGRITCEMSDAIHIVLAGNLDLNMATIDEVKEKYGKPFTEEQYDDVISIVYENPNSTSIYERYTIDFDTGTKHAVKFDVVNFVAAGDDATGDTASNEEAAGVDYREPTTMGTDPASFCVSVKGSLYSLPAPVSAFTDNGWTFLSSADLVGAGTYKDDIMMEKDGLTVQVGVMNFSDRRASIGDCAVYKVKESRYENSGIGLIIPGNIKVGSTLSEAEKRLSTLTRTESAAGIEFQINTRERMLTVYISKDTMEVDSITVINRMVD